MEMERWRRVIGQAAARVAPWCRAVGRAADRLVFPAECLACDAVDFVASPVAGICAECGAELSWRGGDGRSGRSALAVGRRRFDQVVIALRYQPPIDEVILRLKYGHLELAAAPLADALAQATMRLPAFERPDLLAPLPMHWLKRWLRGGDHADLLVERLAARLDLPVRHALARVRATRAQGGARSLRERVHQVQSAFAVRAAVRGAHVGLVDDVVTSGATAATAARALRRAGARAVTLLAVAGNG